MEDINKGNKNLITDPYRETLRKSIALLLIEHGFTSATQIAIETLVEMIASLLSSISLSTRNYTEYAHRTQPTIGDVVLALASNGIDMEKMEEFAFRNRQIVIDFKPNAKNKPQEPLPKVLPHPPEHSYRRSATFIKPLTEHEACRKVASEGKRSIEKALAKYLARTSMNPLSLFDGKKKDKNFLIDTGRENLSTPSYLSALNPIDQIFDFEELEYYYQVRNAKIEEHESFDVEENDNNNGYIEYEVSPLRRNSDEDLLDTAITINKTLSSQSSTSSSRASQQYVNPFLQLIKNQDN